MDIYEMIDNFVETNINDVVDAVLINIGNCSRIGRLQPLLFAKKETEIHRLTISFTFWKI